MQILVLLIPLSQLLKNYLDFAVTQDFPYSYSIHMLNDLSSDLLPVILRYEVDSYNMDLRLALTTNWDQYTDILSHREVPDLIQGNKAEAEQAISMLGNSL